MILFAFDYFFFGATGGIGTFFLSAFSLPWLASLRCCGRHGVMNRDFVAYFHLAARLVFASRAISNRSFFVPFSITLIVSFNSAIGPVT